LLSITVLNTFKRYLLQQCRTQQLAMDFYSCSFRNV